MFPQCGVRDFERLNNTIANAVLLAAEEHDSVTVEFLDALAVDVEEKLPHIKEGKEAHKEKVFEAIRNSFRNLLGKKLDPGIRNKIAMTISGRWQELRYGNTCAPWKGDMYNNGVWAPCRALDISRALCSDLKYDTEIQCYAGPGTGVKILLRLSDSGVQHYLKRIGAPRFSGTPSEDLGGLYLTGWLQTTGKQVSIQSVYASAAQERINKELLSERKEKCTGTFAKGQLCFNCPVSRVECRLSRHADEYKKDLCRISRDPSERHKGYLVKDNICIYCLKSGKALPYIKEKEESERWRQH